MVNEELANSYLRRAKIRCEILKEYLKREDYADVIRMDVIPEEIYKKEDALEAIGIAEGYLSIAYSIFPD